MFAVGRFMQQPVNDLFVCIESFVSNKRIDFINGGRKPCERQAETPNQCVTVGFSLCGRIADRINRLMELFCHVESSTSGGSGRLGPS